MPTQAQDLETLRSATECRAKAMLAELGTGYRPGRALPSVGDFQKAWNELEPMVRGVPGVRVPSQNKGKLIVDSLYGAQSSVAASNFLDVAPPPRAADVPVWFGRNHGAVEQMCPPHSPVNPVPPGPQLPPVQTVPSVQQAVAPAQVLPAPQPPPAYVPPMPQPPPIVTATLPPARPPVTDVPLTVVTSPIPVPTPSVDMPAVPPPGIRLLPPAEVMTRPVVTLDTAPRTLPTTVVTAPRAKGGAGALAIGIGAVALAGGLSILLFRKRRRR